MSQSKSLHIMEQELLPIVEVLTYWQYYCKGTRHCIQVYTDHHNLWYFNTLECINKHLVCWLTQLQCFDYTIHYRPSQKNSADALLYHSNYCIDPNNLGQST